MSYHEKRKDKWKHSLVCLIIPCYHERKYALVQLADRFLLLLLFQLMGLVWGGFNDAEIE